MKSSTNTSRFFGYARLRRESVCTAFTPASVAFSGEYEHGGAKVTESSLNGFPSSEISDRIQEDPYRFLVCADKFQTGYDEALLHTMYVDKPGAVTPDAVREPKTSIASMSSSTRSGRKTRRSKS
jgi:hypothetical protein